MMVNDVVVFILVVFLLLGVVDYCLGNRWGLGEWFVDGFKVMGLLVLFMIGIVLLVFVLVVILIFIVFLVYIVIGVDFLFFVNIILVIDMGGYVFVGEMVKDLQVGLFLWVFLGMMMGLVIVFMIFVVLSIIEKEDYLYFVKGILIGLCIVLIGCLIGGLCVGFNIIMIG